MIANYGYKDGSGDYFISINTNKCNGCKDCLTACLKNIFEVTDDPNDPLNDQQVAIISETQRKKIKYTCAPCKPISNKIPLPCISACKPGAISHSW